MHRILRASRPLVSGAVLAGGATVLSLSSTHVAMGESLGKDTEFRGKWESTVRGLQSDFCETIERIDGKAKFKLDEWKRAEGGGGWTRVLTQGQGEWPTET